MIIVMKSDVLPESPEVQQVIRMAERYPDVRAEVRKIQGATRVLTEIYLLGSTAQIPREPFEEFDAVEKVIRIRERYRVDRPPRRPGGGGRLRSTTACAFSQDTFHVFAGLCARRHARKRRDDVPRPAASSAFRPPAPARTSRAPAPTTSRATARTASRSSSSSPASTASRSSPWRSPTKSHVERDPRRACAPPATPPA